MISAGEKEGDGERQILFGKDRQERQRLAGYVGSAAVVV
jgi:hypothetical protein